MPRISLTKNTKLNELIPTIIFESLKMHEWNRTHTAQGLGVSLRTITNYVRAFRKKGMTVPKSTWNDYKRCNEK